MEQLALKAAQSLSRTWRGGATLVASWGDHLGGRAPAVRTACSRATVALRRLGSLLVEAEIITRAEAAEHLADLAAARRDAEHWRVRTGTCEAQIAQLEQQIAASNLVAMDLRSRLVCLHAKLATTAATARYQTSIDALASRARKA